VMQQRYQLVAESRLWQMYRKRSPSETVE